MQCHNLRQLAGSVFADHYQALVSQEAGVFSSEVEAVHDMRVATRRLRVALSNFAVCCDPGIRRSLRAQLGRLADQLGAVRDLDVMLAALKRRKAELPAAQKPFLRGLIRRLQARRLRCRRRLRGFLRGADYAEFKREFRNLISEASDLSVGIELPPQTESQDKDGEGIQG